MTTETPGRGYSSGDFDDASPPSHNPIVQLEAWPVASTAIVTVNATGTAQPGYYVDVHIIVDSKICAAQSVMGDTARRAFGGSASLTLDILPGTTRTLHKRKWNLPATRS